MNANEDAGRLVDAKINALGDWRGAKLAQLRAVIKTIDPGMVEDMKWKKPSNPTGVPVWSHDGIVCIGEALKNAVRLTFPKGASIPDSKKLFNARLDSNSVRAIDFREDAQRRRGCVERDHSESCPAEYIEGAAAVTKPAADHQQTHSTRS
jgi:hypothetical protein